MGRARETCQQARAARLPDEAAPLFETALTLSREEGDRETEALSLLGLGTYALGMGDYPKAKERLLVARPILESLALTGRIGECLYLLWVARDAGDPCELPLALELLEKGGAPEVAGDCCRALARVRSDDALYARAMEFYRKADSPLSAAVTLHHRARLALERQLPQTALTLLQESLRQLSDIRVSPTARRIEAEVLEEHGNLLLSLGRRDEATRNLQDAVRLFNHFEMSAAARRVSPRLESIAAVEILSRRIARDEWENRILSLRFGGKLNELWELLFRAPPGKAYRILRDLSQAGFVPGPADRERFVHLSNAARKDFHFAVDHVRVAAPDEGKWVPTGFAFSPDGARMGVLPQGGSRILFWDPLTGEEQGSVDHEPRRSGALDQVRLGSLAPAGVSFAPQHALSPDGARFYTDDGHGQLRIIDAASGRVVKETTLKADHATRIAVSPDGREVAFGLRSGAVELRDADLEKPRRLERPGNPPINDWVSTLAYSPDGRLLAAATTERGLALWDVGSERMRGDYPGPHEFAAFSPEGGRVVMRDGLVVDLDAMTSATAAGLKGFSPGPFSPDGRTLFAAGPESFGLWDIAAWKWRISLDRRGWSLPQAHVSTKGAWQAGAIYGEASPSPRPQVRIWTILDDQPLETMTADHLKIARKMAGKDPAFRFLADLLSK